MEEVDVYQSAMFETQHTTKGTDPRPNKGYQAAAETPVKIDWPESPSPYSPPNLPGVTPCSVGHAGS